MHDITGRRVREARDAAGITQEELAEACGLHRTTVSHVEAGRRSVPMHALVPVADALGVSVDWILGREGYGI